MKRIIVNADDFGRHRRINEAVERGVTEGILRSATLMAGGRAFADAADRVRRLPELGLGIHFTLVDGFPILPPEEIPSLVDENGVFLPNYGAFSKHYAKGGVRLAEVRAELAAQLPTVAGEQVLARCCTPLVHVHRYTYRAPLRDAGVPAVGVAGACSAEGRDVLIGVLTDVLPRLPAVRLLLPAAVAAVLAEDGIARLAATGTAASVLEIVEELPYAELDLVLGMDVDFMDVCRAADHGVPLLTAAPFVYDHASAYVLTQLGCPPVRTVQELARAVCRLLADPAASALAAFRSVRCAHRSVCRRTRL